MLLSSRAWPHSRAERRLRKLFCQLLPADTFRPHNQLRPRSQCLHPAFEIARHPVETNLAEAGRPLFRLDLRVRNRRKPFRCQDTTVSGLTRINARRQSFQLRDRQTQKGRSVPRSRGCGHCRLMTASC